MRIAQMHLSAQRNPFLPIFRGIPGIICRCYIACMKKRNLIDLCAGWLVLVFVYTAVNKLSDIGQFQRSLSEIPGITSLSWPLALGIPLTELVISALLFSDRFRRRAFLFSAILLCIFTIYIAAIMIWSEDLPCSCGGVLESFTWKQHLVFNIFCIAIGCAGYLLERSENIYCNKSGVAENPLTE